jgi:hypothetical protein
MLELFLKPLTMIVLLLIASRGFAAGAVIGEPGSCFIEIGIYSAHFTIYQPDSRGNQEFCEDLPDTGNTLFVLDYLHGSMKEVPVEFRIIRDDDDLGIFARWENVKTIEDIDARTVFYQAPSVESDNQLTVEHNFLEPGAYIGIVSAPHPTKDLHYHAVFPFQVGRIVWWPWFLLLATFIGVGLYIYRKESHVAK